MGVFVSIEGGDGSGKATQSKLLCDYLTQRGAEVGFESFPRYLGPVRFLLSDYLNGRYGTEVHPRLASSIYSLDRLSAKDDIDYYIHHENGAYITDRFGDSNKGHQGGRLKTDAERLEFFAAQDAFEHDGLGIPKPDKTILMPVPPVLAQEYIDRKSARTYTESKRDIHEADVEHLQNAYDSYMLLAEHEPERIIIIDPVEANKKALRPIADIHKDIVRALTPLFDERLNLQ